MRQPIPPEEVTSQDRSAVLLSVAPRQWAPSFFGVVSRREVRRRPSDAIQLVVAGLLVVAAGLATNGFTSHGTEIFRAMSAWPNWLDSLATWIFLACTVGAVVVVLIALVGTRNFRLALTLVAVACVALLVEILLGQWLDVDALRKAAGDAASDLSPDSLRWLTIATAMLLTVAPYLVRPVRRTVRSVVALAIVGAVVAPTGPFALVLAAIGVGWGISAAANLAIGTPRATPSEDSVAAALEALGISITTLSIADDQVMGETRFVGRSPEGDPASVVVIGRDAADARFAHKLWRAVLYRDAGPKASVSRSAQLEHRAYLLLMAAKAGVPVSSVVIAARAGADDLAMLVLLDPPGRPFSEVSPDELTDSVVDRVWDTVGRLHTARLSHGALAPSHLVLAADGTIALEDFSRGSAGTMSDRRDADCVDVLVSTAVLVGNDRAIAAAQRALGDDGLTGLLPMVQTAALAAPVRRVVPDSKKWLKTLREAGAEATGGEKPKLTELRRVSASSVFMAAATFLGFYLIVNQFAGVDIAASLATARPSWVLVAFVFSFVPQFSGSVALMGSVGKPLPFVPVLAEQFANNFTGLIGGTVATTALVIRFFEKQGLKVAVAASSGVMNSIAGSIVQFVIVVVGLIFTSTSFVPSSTGGGHIGQVVIVAIIVIGIGITVGLLVPRLRALLRRTVKPQLVAAKENLMVILKDPRKAAMIFGGNLCSQLFYALVIDAALRAYGVHLPFLQVMVINSLASFFGGMAPVPGGMGVIEAGLIGGMTAAGVPQSEAVAATFTARLFTSYLPPIWGWVSMRWLVKHDYV